MHARLTASFGVYEGRTLRLTVNLKSSNVFRLLHQVLHDRRKSLSDIVSYLISQFKWISFTVDSIKLDWKYERLSGNCIRNSCRKIV
jgi:hypothetical protein